MKNNKKLLPILIVIGVVLISIGATLAFINYSKNGQTENTIRLGNLTFHYEEGNRSISILDALPVDSDDDAKSSNNYFDFRITANTTFAEIPYVVTGRLSEDSDLDPSVVKVYLTRVSGNSETQLLYTTLDQLENKTFLNNGFVDKVLYRDTVPVNGSNYEVNYRLRLWIAEDTNFATGLYNNKRLSLTVNVYTNEGQSLTNEHITSPDDTSLKMISANGMYLLTPSSDTGVDYEATVPAEVNTVSFDVTEKNILATSTVTEIGQTLTMGNVRRMSSHSGTYNLLTGNNYYRIRTTSADTTQTKDYIIKIEKELSRDNNLSYLAVTGYSFDETFDETGNDTTYHITMEGDSIVLEGNNNGGATIEGLGEKELVWGENTFTITVTPQNPNEPPKTYTIIVNNVRPEAPSITGGTGNTWASTDSTITIGESGSAISGIDGYEYVITTDANTTVNDNTQATGTLTTSPYSLTVTNEGTSYIYYRTISEDGNKSEWSNRIVVNVLYTLSNKLFVDNTIIETPLTSTDLSQSVTTDNTGKLFKQSVTNGYGGANGDTYFFRGEVNNNIVDFAGLTWRIVRRNENGTVRLLLDDTITLNGGKASNFIDPGSSISAMYYSNGGSIGNDTTKPNAKYFVEQWYNATIGNNNTYSSKVATGNYFCEAAKVKWDDNYTANQATLTARADYMPTLDCIADGNGHGLLNASVGLITYDEARFAGSNEKGVSNRDYYISKKADGTLKNPFWTMSPAGFRDSNGNAAVWQLSMGLIKMDLLPRPGQISPVINLRADVRVTGTGAANDHYIVQ